MKLAVIANGDPENVRTWSGTAFHMLRALQVEFSEVVSIYRPTNKIYTAIQWRLLKLSAGRVDINWLPGVASARASVLLKDLRTVRPNLVICIANTPLGAVISSYFPTIHVSDTTFALMQDYYPDFAKLSLWIKHAANSLEQQIISNSEACLYSSQWASDSAVRDYGADPKKIHFVPWGCNMETSVQPTDIFSRTESHSICSIIFIGVDWIRKGGDIALATVTLLRRAGLHAHLHVIGAKPEGSIDNEIVTWHGFLSKSTPEGIARLDLLLREAAFLLLPTRQDCTPMVFAEVNTYGIPAISTSTGGIGSVLRDGINGYALPEAAGPEAYGALIAEIWSDRERYLDLRKSSRNHSETFLNWKNWAGRMRQIVENL
jgi:glycosyltransferase involved in cell wall biosynthesis